MTIAVTLKVHDGIVLAADSASTMTVLQPDGSIGVANVYNNANKIVNLLKGHPIGAMVWGAGAVGPSSVTTVLKDIRAMFEGEAQGPGGSDWSIDAANMSVERVAERVREYIGENLYPAQWPNEAESPQMGVMIAGYSKGSPHAELYELSFGGTYPPPAPAPVLEGPQSGYSVGGEPEAVVRLLTGASTGLEPVLINDLGIPPEDAVQAGEIIRANLTAPLVQDAMPFIDALDLGRFLVRTTVEFRVSFPDPQRLAGPSSWQASPSTRASSGWSASTTTTLR